MFALNQGEIYLPFKIISSWDIYDKFIAELLKERGQ
jgi:hypothetical protein